MFLYVTILVEMKPVYWGLKGNQGMYLYPSIRFNWYDMWYDWMISTYAIHIIKMKSEYWGLKRNQGTGIAYESVWIQYDWNEVSMSEMKYIWLKWTKKGLWLKIYPCVVCMNDDLGVETLYMSDF